MTVKEFYEWCKEHNATDYTLADKNGYMVFEQDIEIKPEIPDEMKGEVWI